jgi:phosphatidylserine decarboxylase
MATLERDATTARPPAPPAAAPSPIPIAADGWPFILVPLGLGLLAAGLGWRRLALLPLGVAGFMGYFFRDPERHPPALPGAVLSPADGRVTEGGREVIDPFVGPARQVSIFLSPLDVHVNRAAVSGRVVDVEYRPGAFRAAYRPEAEQNERVSIAIEGDAGRVVMRQVAGVLARRIVCRVGPGDRLEAGQRFGMIRFGSRMDVLMPARARVLVGVGDRVRAGETIVGVLEVLK